MPGWAGMILARSCVPRGMIMIIRGSAPGCVSALRTNNGRFRFRAMEVFPFHPIISEKAQEKLPHR